MMQSDVWNSKIPWIEMNVIVREFDGLEDLDLSPPMSDDTLYQIYLNYAIQKDNFKKS